MLALMGLAPGLFTVRPLEKSDLLKMSQNTHTPFMLCATFGNINQTEAETKKPRAFANGHFSMLDVFANESDGV
jgi:hypothetical protein